MRGVQLLTARLHYMPRKRTIIPTHPATATAVPVMLLAQRVLYCCRSPGTFSAPLPDKCINISISIYIHVLYMYSLLVFPITTEFHCRLAFDFGPRLRLPRHP